MAEPVFVHETEHALVRIHEGKRTKAEQAAALESASRLLAMKIQKKGIDLGDENGRSAS